MNDRFKFRAWYNPGYREPIMLYDVEQTYDDMFGEPESVPSDSFGSVLHNKDFVVMQCTGLHDKNGKLIYEGDIIYSPSWWWGACFVHLNIGQCGPCKGDSVMSYILAKSIDNPLEGAIYNIWNGSEVEVIGNIFDNPELLGGADNG